MSQLRIRPWIWDSKFKPRPASLITDSLQVLGLLPEAGREATLSDVQRAFRRRAALVHPDKCGLPGAEAAFKLLGAAASHVQALLGCGLALENKLQAKPRYGFYIYRKRPSSTHLEAYTWASSSFLGN